MLGQAVGNRHKSSVRVVDNPPKGGRFQAKRIRRQKGLASDRIFGEYRSCKLLRYAPVLPGHRPAFIGGFVVSGVCFSKKRETNRAEPLDAIGGFWNIC